MASAWTAITTFLQNILILIAGGSIGSGSDAVTVQGLVPWITNNSTVAIFVLAIPLVSFAVVFPICDKYVVSDMPSELVTVR